MKRLGLWDLLFHRNHQFEWHPAPPEPEPPAVVETQVHGPMFEKALNDSIHAGITEAMQGQAATHQQQLAANDDLRRQYDLAKMAHDSAIQAYYQSMRNQRR